MKIFQKFLMWCHGRMFVEFWCHGNILWLLHSHWLLWQFPKTYSWSTSYWVLIVFQKMDGHIGIIKKYMKCGQSPSMRVHALIWKYIWIRDTRTDICLDCRPPWRLIWKRVRMAIFIIKNINEIVPNRNEISYDVSI